MLAAYISGLQAAQIADIGLNVLGGLCGLGYMVWLLSSDRWRNPLAGRACNRDGPRLRDVVLMGLLFVGLAGMLGAVLVRGIPRAAAIQPGSQGWHLAQTAEAVAKLVVAAVMVIILARRPAFPPAERRGLGLWGVVAVGVLGALVVTPVCSVQLQMGTVIWQWLNPGHVPPVHPVLLAIRNTVWGAWGGVQLAVIAVLVAPLAEELFFRGLLLSAVWRHTGQAWVAVLVAGLAFGAIHGQPQDILPLCTMGVILGYVRLQTRSLPACVLAHALFNARTMAMALFFPELFYGS